MSKSKSIPENDAAPRYEIRDVDTVSLAMLVVLLIICVTLVEMTISGMLSVLDRRAAPYTKAPANEVTVPQFPEPRLQLFPRVDLEALHAREEAQLHSYGWVDQKAGVARIPIERAMELLLERGLPETHESFTPLELQQKRPEQNPARQSEPPGKTP